MTNIETLNIDTMSLAEFEQYLPDFFSAYDGHISDNPRFTVFLNANPDCANLVRDLEYIAATAKSLFEPEDSEIPNDWAEIQTKLSQEPASEDPAQPHT
jgi:hypothetical protein